MSKTDNDIRKDATASIVKNHMIWSMGAGFIPVPIADLFAVSAIQLDMIRQMCKIYDIDFKATEGKAIITTLTGSSLARLGARAVKFIPGVGSVLGGITMAVLSGASTFALGEVFRKHFETGGTFLDFDLGRLKKYYKEKFEKGKKMARKMQKQQQEQQEFFSKKETPKTDPIEKLKELSDLKKDGIISEEEFVKMKNKIMEDFDEEN